jgi:hypothetical protein
MPAPIDPSESQRGQRAGSAILRDDVADVTLFQTGTGGDVSKTRLGSVDLFAPISRQWHLRRVALTNERASIQ